MSIRIVQISDLHIYANSDGSLLGCQTRVGFDAVVDAIFDAHLPMDLMLLTGDLSHDGSVESYQYIAQRLRVFDCPIYWLAGNHDHVETMESVLTQTQLCAEKELHFPSWSCIFLNSVVAGEAYGWLGPKELTRLTRFLSANSHKNTLISLHHPPIPTQSTWLDTVGLYNADEFQRIIRSFSSIVRLVIVGHVHQALDCQHEGVHYVGTPSTCIQFLPNSVDFILDSQHPGYRYIELYDNGMVNTLVKRLPEFEMDIDFSAKGY